MSATRETSTHLADVETNYRTTIDFEASEAGIAGNWLTDHHPQNKKEYYEHLNNTNKGLKNGRKWWNQKAHTRFANASLIQIVSDQLGLLPPQKEDVEWFFLRQNLGRAGVSKVLVAAGTCLYRVHSDDRDQRKCHPQTPHDDLDSIYYKAMKYYTLPKDELASMYGKVQNRYPNGYF